MKENTRAVIGVTMMMVAGFGLSVWHVYSAWLVNDAKGFGWALAVLFTPPFSDLILLGATIRAAGFLNWYIGSFVLLCAAYGTSHWLIASANPDA